MLLSIKSPLAILTCALSLSTACGAPSAPYRSPDHWSRAEAYGGGHDDQLTGDTTPYYALTNSSEDQRAPLVTGEPASPGRSFYEKAPPPLHAPSLSGSSCLSELNRRGVAHTRISNLKGVENPIEVRGQLGGVEFWANDGRRLQMDCRLAIALDELGTTMSGFGVKRIRYSGAYVYRTTRSGRLSHHALGLAIDLHDFETATGRLSVKQDFVKNAGCAGQNPLLNSLSCKMREQALFEEFLTPDYNADHRDHLHISVPRRKVIR